MPVKVRSSTSAWGSGETPKTNRGTIGTSGLGYFGANSTFFFILTIEDFSVEYGTFRCLRTKSLLAILGDSRGCTVAPMLVRLWSVVYSILCSLLLKRSEDSPTSKLLRIELTKEVLLNFSIRFLTDYYFFWSTTRATLGDKILRTASLVVPSHSLDFMV